MAETPTGSAAGGFGHGLYNGKTAPQLATDAEQSFQGISHLTELDATRLEPTELYRTLSALTRAVERLPDVVQRISAQLNSWVDQEELVVAAGPFHGDPDAAIAALNSAVDERVVPALAQLRTGLEAAQAAVNELGRQDDEATPSGGS